MDDLLVERVLLAVEQVPPGEVVSYGDLAGLVGIGPRQVGAVMSRHGAGVAWWRVTNASGDLPVELRPAAFARWAAEGIAVKPNGCGCRIREHRTDLVALADAYDLALASLSSAEAGEPELSSGFVDGNRGRVRQVE